MKTALLAAAALLVGAPATTALAQQYEPTPGPALQQQLDQARAQAAHDEAHRQIENAHDSAHAGGFSSEQEHQAYHQNLDQLHGAVHDEHAAHEDAHHQIEAAHAEAHGTGFNSEQEHQAYHQNLNQLHDQVHGNEYGAGSYPQQYAQPVYRSQGPVQYRTSSRTYSHRSHHRRAHVYRQY